ncbi:MAG: GPW/gp25 family protein [Deltaproteobacteria bacterium]
MTTPRDHLGTGFKFPLRVDARGGLTWSSGREDIAQAIWIILSTVPGERQMRPEFGCGIHEYVFAPNNAVTRSQISSSVRRALTAWEPRVDVLEVRVEEHPSGDNAVLIRVDYRIRSNNALHNIVYPFYLEEGARR